MNPNLSSFNLLVYAPDSLMKPFELQFLHLDSYQFHGIQDSIFVSARRYTFFWVYDRHVAVGVL